MRSFAHDAATWDNRDIALMYFEAIKWALGLSEGDATPGREPRPSRRPMKLARRESRRRVPAVVHRARRAIARLRESFPKHVLAWADVRNGYQHESITHALSTIERLGWESGLYDTIIRTDSQSITKSPILFKTGHRHRQRRAVPGPQPELLRRDLLLRRARDRSRRRSSAPTCCRSSATTARGSWRRMPARPRSSRGPSSARCWAAASTSIPWGISEATVIVEDRESPITRAPAASLRRHRRALSDQGLLAEERPRAGSARSRRGSI